MGTALLVVSRSVNFTETAWVGLTYLEPCNDSSHSICPILNTDCFSNEYMSKISITRINRPNTAKMAKI